MDSDASPWPASNRQKGADYEAKRDAVIEAAAKLFRERGYDKTTTSQIAAELNISKPTLYYYVKDKAEILAECRRRMAAQLEAAQAGIDDPALSGRQRLEMYLRAYVAAVSSDIGKAIVITIGEAAVDRSGDLDSLRISMGRSNRVLEALLSEGVRDGSIVTDDPKLASFALYGAMNWIAYWHRDGRGPSTAVADAFVRLFFEGLAPRADPSG